MYYPELLVSPKATERVTIEAQKEKQNGIIFNLPLQISSTLTFTSGLLMMGDTKEGKDPDKYSSLTGIGIGAGWLIINSYLGYLHRPYIEAKIDLNKIPAKTPEETLMRERLAEEAIRDAGLLAYKLNWFAAITNLGASIYMISNAKEKSKGQLFAGISIVASMLPLIFDHPWYQVYKDQQTYKRKIYGPLTLMPALLSAPDHRLAQGVILHYSF